MNPIEITSLLQYEILKKRNELISLEKEVQLIKKQHSEFKEALKTIASKNDLNEIIKIAKETLGKNG